MDIARVWRPSRSHHRATWPALGSAILTLGLLVSPAWAAKPGGGAAGGGNHGTMKVVSQPDGSEASDNDNDPKVSCFSLRFVYGEPDHAGAWWIYDWAPTGSGTLVRSGSYLTDGSGADETATIQDLDPGHYRVDWQGSDDTHAKHKMLWVTEVCPSGDDGDGDEPPGDDPGDVPDTAAGSQDLPALAVGTGVMLLLATHRLLRPRRPRDGDA